MAKKAIAKSSPRSAAKVATDKRSKDGAPAPKKKPRSANEARRQAWRTLAAEACYIEDDGKAGSQVDDRQSSPNGGWSREFDRVQRRRAGDVASQARRGKEIPLIRSIP